ncbi:NUDIX domain-containing protein [Neobacillus sp. PS3-40]|uniref:NUDIX hydrolase n=1 Tax=Neobacillus sp. PS3-40 TaxID=3070679 RepID=UPI0027DEC275|nr:NUDIX domain-containing protein [Neobacillus sp. PS3-40]WML43832.1 NUDIX domain-containing protein [Neobacillus sp. PS3-40]
MAQNGIVLVVSVSIIKDDEVLMIKENKPSAANKWNFPSGRIEYKEDILNAACREVKEETGLDVELISTTGIYNFISSAGNQVILFHFTGEITGGSLNLEEEIIDSGWFKVLDLLNFNVDELREASVVKQIADSLIKKNFHSINIFNQQIR